MRPFRDSRMGSPSRRQEARGLQGYKGIRGLKYVATLLSSAVRRPGSQNPEGGRDLNVLTALGLSFHDQQIRSRFHTLQSRQV